MTSSLSSLQRRWDRRLNLGLAILWCVVAWRTGLVALGYATLMFISDVQALVGPPLPQTLSTRHPYGVLVDLTAGELRRAWWVAPHLRHAEQLFLWGARGSLIMWAFIALVMLRHRARLSPAIDARLNLIIDTVEALAFRRLPDLLRKGVHRVLKGVVSRPKAPSSELIPIEYSDHPTALEVGRRMLGLVEQGGTETPSDGPSPREKDVEKFQASDCSGQVSVVDSDEASPEQSSPPSEAAYPTSFFTRF